MSIKHYLGKTVFYPTGDSSCAVFNEGPDWFVNYSVHFTDHGVVCFAYNKSVLEAVSGIEIALLVAERRGMPRAHCEFLFLGLSEPRAEKDMRTVILKARRPGLKNLYHCVNNPEQAFANLLADQ